MLATSPESAVFTLTLTGAEREQLTTFLEQLLRNKQIEVHRTEAFAFREELERQVALLESLIARLRQS